MVDGEEIKHKIEVLEWLFDMAGKHNEVVEMYWNQLGVEVIKRFYCPISN